MSLRADERRRAQECPLCCFLVRVRRGSLSSLIGPAEPPLPTRYFFSPPRRVSLCPLDQPGQRRRSTTTPRRWCAPHSSPDPRLLAASTGRRRTRPKVSAAGTARKISATPNVTSQLLLADSGKLRLQRCSLSCIHGRRNEDTNMLHDAPWQYVPVPGKAAMTFMCRTGQLF